MRSSSGIPTFWTLKELLVSRPLDKMDDGSNADSGFEIQGTNHSRPQSPQSFWPAAEIESSGWFQAGSSTQTQKFETIVVASGYKNAPSLRLRISRNWPELSIPEGSWALGTRMGTNLLHFCYSDWSCAKLPLEVQKLNKMARETNSSRCSQITLTG